MKLHVGIKALLNLLLVNCLVEYIIPVLNAAILNVDAEENAGRCSNSNLYSCLWKDCIHRCTFHLCPKYILVQECVELGVCERTSWESLDLSLHLA
jgi:hypothetical protein